MADLDDFDPAYRTAFPYHDENLAMLAWYAARLVGHVRRRRAKTLLSLGIGHMVVAEAILGSLVPELDRYTIVEGSARRITELSKGRDLAGVEVVQDFFESFAIPEPVDAIEMGFVLEHVEDPARIVARYAEMMAPGGSMIIVVPNARSLHRLVGHEAGLLEDLYQLSPADAALGHRRYFDRDSLEALVRDAGLRVEATEGIFLKCLTTAQLSGLALPEPVARAFYEVGHSMPDICNAIWVDARHVSS